MNSGLAENLGPPESAFIDRAIVDHCSRATGIYGRKEAVFVAFCIGVAKNHLTRPKQGCILSHGWSGDVSSLTSLSSSLPLYRRPSETCYSRARIAHFATVVWLALKYPELEPKQLLIYN